MPTVRDQRQHQDRDGASDEDRRAGSGKGPRSGAQPRQVKGSHVITEHIDVGVPTSVAFGCWTRYDKWSEIFKKESAKKQEEEGDDNRVDVTAKIGPSRRQWRVEIVNSEPGRRISWRSRGGLHAEGSTSFHRLDDRLTRLMVEMEYEPSGFLEVVGNFFRMQRRRVRRDLRLFKHYAELRGADSEDESRRPQASGGRRGRSEQSSSGEEES